MSTSNIVRGRDGRCLEVLSKSDFVNEEFWDKINGCDLRACEKWILLSVVDLIDLTGFSLTQVREVKEIVCKKLHPVIYQAIELGNDTMISFGSKKLDSILIDILKSGLILELWGEAGSGKTQLALQICSALQPEYHSAYISTEGAVPTSRLLDMCNARGMSQVNCEIQQCTSLEGFTECVMKQLPILIQMKTIKLIIIDSIAAIFRAGVIDDDGIQRAQKIRSIGQQLKYLAHHHNLLVLVLNQVTENPSAGMMPALGMTWAYLVNSRLRIQKINSNEVTGQRRIIVQKSPCLKIGTFVDCQVHQSGII